ncbi:uncharacterized protein MONBRDRAFT_2234, partial [Monosiga brevicollis MX1]
YRLFETIGLGGYSKVKVAKAIETGQRVAVKIIDKVNAPKGYLQKFLPREITALRRLCHPRIAQLQDLIETEQRVYLVLTYAVGGDLLEYINTRGPMNEAKARRLFFQLLSAVHYCHTLRIVHRDLKCENVLLDGDGNVLLTGNHRLLTHCGSYAYAAPEVLMGHTYAGDRSDMWSLGVILYAMVCGQLPFNDRALKLIMAGVHHRLQIASTVSQDLRDFLEKILVADPRWRATPTDLLQHPWLQAHV